jgi:hypothetical protein
LRIWDTRYTRDLRRYRLAWWMIRLEARTRTVALWTGLSVYRVKTFREAYAGGGEKSQRGPSPYRVGQFWNSLQSRTETAILAGFLSVYGVLPEPGSAIGPLETLGRGERLCQAYEEFSALWPEAELKLEHAMLLLGELVRGVEMEVTECSGCDVLVVADRLASAPPQCAFCMHELHFGRRYDQRPLRRGNGGVAEEFGPGSQGSLF